MPVGAGGGALGRIEAALVADAPALVAAFRAWREPPWSDPTDGGVSRVDLRTGLALLLGLAALAVGPVGTVVGVVAVVVVLAGRVYARWADRVQLAQRPPH